MILRKQFARLHAIACMVAASAMAAPSAADSIASKIEAQGEMSYLKVTDLRQAVRGGLLVIQAEVTNEKEGQQTLYYRFRWLDASGFSMWDDEAWKPLLFHGKGKHLIQVVAPTLQAADFRLMLQSPENRAAPASTW